MSNLDLALAGQRLLLTNAQRREWPDSRIMTMEEVYREWLNFKDVSESYKHQMLMSLVMCLQYPVVIYYECSKRDGKYQYRGARVGPAGSQYLSGFPAPL